MQPKRQRLLFVDDEQLVLDGIALNLRRAFDVVTATSGEFALELIANDPDFAVVVSDMRMPKMSGSAFLARARELAPDAIRILLTGQADMSDAIRAVNDGQIFRFLTKPCGRDELRVAIDAAVEFARAKAVERDLLDQTVRGSVKMLVDILALTKPAAFGRAHRIKTRVLALAAELGVRETWQLEIAALSSQLGYITLPHELWDKLEHDRPLTFDDRVALAKAPAMAAELLGNIPRLETVRDILLAHVKPPRMHAAGTDRLVFLGANCLRLALDLDELEAAGAPSDVVPRAIDAYAPEVIAALEGVIARRVSHRIIVDIPVAKLRVGMVLADDVRLANGTLVVTRGYEVTGPFIERVRNFPGNTFSGIVRVITESVADAA